MAEANETGSRAADGASVRMEAGNGAAIVPAASETDVQATATIKNKSLSATANLRATGWWASLGLSGVPLVVFVVFRPESVSADRAVLVVAFLAFLAGASFVSVAKKEELERAISNEREFRDEIVRMAGRHGRLQGSLLKERLSSVSPPPPPASRKGPNKAKRGK